MYPSAYPSAGSAGAEGLGRAVGAGGEGGREGGPQAACLGTGLPAEQAGPAGRPGPSCALRRRGMGPRGARVGRGRWGRGRGGTAPALPRSQGSPQEWLEIKLVRCFF